MSSRLDRVARHRRVLAGAAALLAVGVTATTVPAFGETAPAPVQASATTVSWVSGVHSGPSVPENEQFAAFRGRPLGAITLFQGSSSASEMSNVDYLASQFKGSRARLVLSSALWPQGSGGSLARSSRGEYDAIYRQLGRNLVAKGLPNVTIRLGWEFNGDWQPWRVLTPTDAAQFANTWRHFVTAMRSVPGGRFTYDWAPVAINGLQNPAKAWPGSRYVDVVGMSVYNYTPNALQTAPAKRFAQIKGWKYGLNWHTRFAKLVGKRVSYPEWGAINRPFNPAVSSGDDPYFIAAMFNHFAATRPAYEMYFDVDSVDFTFYGLNTGSQINPKSAAMYKSLWGRR